MEIKLGGPGRGAHRAQTTKRSKKNKSKKPKLYQDRSNMEKLMSRGDGIPQGTASSGLSDLIRSRLVQQIRNLWKAKARRLSRWTESDSTQEPKELKKKMMKYHKYTSGI